MTYSIVGADKTTREVGGAGTSCLMGEDVYVIYQAVSGHGVVHAQAYYNLNGRRRAAELLSDSQPPLDIISQITMKSFDASASLRQYGIVDALGRSAGFTGADTMPFAAAQQGEQDGFVYAVQGNILTSPRVLEHAAAAFKSGSCDLAERLMSALEAGALDGEGDKRCTPQGIPSDSAFLQVEAPDGPAGSYLSLRVKSSGDQNPLPLLRQQLDSWRAQHPCPTPPQTTSAESSDGGCSCHLAASSSAHFSLLVNPSGVAGFLFGCLLVVARRRQRSSRQLCPTQPP
jgi:uncharacterized Ntn-hydrolase superfamily protein